MSWVLRAACLPEAGSTNVHLFFQTEAGLYREKAAKEICAVCPISEECLDRAMEEEAESGGVYRFGVRGGYNASERMRLSLLYEKYAVHVGEPTDLEVYAISQGMEELYDVDAPEPEESSC